jgi:hypothetical protein
MKICLFHKWEYFDELSDPGPVTAVLFNTKTKVKAAIMQTNRRCTKCGKVQFCSY